MDFPAFVRAARESRRMGVEQFAYLIGVAPATVLQWERQRVARPSVKALENLAKVLGMPVSQMIDEIEKP
jgi:transcriptional regulator with XRE-family HTH domain